MARSQEPEAKRFDVVRRADGQFDVECLRCGGWVVVAELPTVFECKSCKQHQADLRSELREASESRGFRFGA